MTGTNFNDTSLQVLVNSANLQFGTVDPYGRTQIWNRLPNAVFRLGSLGSDGDTTTTTSEGVVLYGQNLQGDTMAPADFGYARIKPMRIGLYNSKSDVAEYIFKVDPNGLYFTDNAFVKTFNVDRLTGVITTKLTEGAAVVSSLGVVGSTPMGGATRPVAPVLYQCFFDTSLVTPKPLWWQGANWVDATGTIVP